VKRANPIILVLSAALSMLFVFFVLLFQNPVMLFVSVCAICGFSPRCPSSVAGRNAKPPGTENTADEKAYINQQREERVPPC
jgi:hypothetical protein